MAGSFPTIVPQADIQQDQQRQDAQAMQDENARAYSRFSDAIDQHAANLNDQYLTADRQAAYQQFSTGVDDALAQMPDETSPFSFEGFSRAFDAHLAQAQQPQPTPSPAPGPTNQKQGPRTGMQDFTNAGGGDVASAVDAATDDPRVQMAMKLGASLEGGLNGPFGVGDNGGSFGPFQINHNQGMHADISPEDSQDPAKATAYMLPEYQAAVEKVPADLWNSDPKQAARLAAFYAERPAVIYDQNRVDAAWNALQNQPSPSSDQSSPGDLAERTDVMDQLNRIPSWGPLSAGASSAGLPPVDTGPSPSDQQTPAQRYNEQAPDGSWRQVTKYADGRYETTPIAAPSQDAQTVYQAQSAGTGGFTSPAENVPLRAGSTPGAQEAVPAPEPAPAPATATTTAVPGQLGGPGFGQVGGPVITDASQFAPVTSLTLTGSDVAPAQGAEADTADRNIEALRGPAKLLAEQARTTTGQDLLHPDLNSLGGINRFATELGQNAGQAVTESTGLSKIPGVEGLTQQVLNPESFLTGPALAGTTAIEGAAGAAARTAISGGIGAANAAGQPGASPTDIAAGAVSGALTAGATEGLLRGVGAILKPASAAALEKLGQTAAPLVDETGAHVQAPAAPAAVVDAVSHTATDQATQMPAMAGGAAGDFAKSLEPLNGLIGTFGQAIDKSATPAEAVRSISQADNAVTALSQAIQKAYDAADLTPVEREDVARIVEGQSTAGRAVSQNAVDVADAIQQTTKATAAMAEKAGVLQGTVENYLTHMVRVPAAEADNGNAITPGVLSEFSRFAMGRARDADGNVQLPTIADLKEWVAANHPTWQVVDDPALLMAAHVKSLATAADHAALGGFLSSYVDPETKLPALSPVRRTGDLPINVPPSMNRWLYRGPAPEEGTIVLSRRGVVGSATNEGQTVVQQAPLLYGTKDLAKLLERYTAPDLLAEPIQQGRIPTPLLRAGDAYRAVNRAIVSMKLLNPVVHGWNLVSETLNQYSNPRALAGIVSDFRQAERIMNDPVAQVNLLKEAPLNLATVRDYATQLADATGNLKAEGRSLPLLSGAGQAVGAVRDADQRLLFQAIGQRLQLASYYGARRLGMDAPTAARYANAKFGQLSRQDLGALTRWIAGNVEFAGNWTTGTGIQLGSLIGKPGFGGYAADLTAAQRATLAGALRADVARGMAMLVGAHALINHQLSGHFPWQNEAGRWLDVDTGQKDAQGRTVYVADPFFRRYQDMLRLASSASGPLAIPGTGTAGSGPLTSSQGLGTTSAATAYGKLAPLLTGGSAAATGSQYLAGGDKTLGTGPPIIGPGSDFKAGLLQVAAVLANDLGPANVSGSMATRTPEGVTLHGQNQLVIKGPAGFTYREGQGIQTPQVGSPADVAAGAAGTLGNVRPVEGPRYLSLPDREQAQKDQAFGPEVLAAYAKVGLPVFTAPSTMNLPKGKGATLDTTSAERDAYLKAKADFLRAQLARNPNPTKVILDRWQQDADTAGKAAVLAGGLSAQQRARVSLPQFTAPAAR